MADFGVNKMFGKLTAGEGKISTDTSLVVDDILKNVALYAPAALLAITFLYTPELSKNAGVQCFHPDAQDWTQMLFVNNYCWESLTGYANPDERVITTRNDTKDSLPIWTDASETENLNYHRAFPFTILTCIFVGLLPTIFWSVIDLDRRIKIEADYLEMGIEEALQLTLRQMVALVKDEQKTEVNELEGGVDTQGRLKALILADMQGRRCNDGSILKEGEEAGDRTIVKEFSGTTIKFKSFKKYLQAKEAQSKLIWRYILKRIMSIVLLALVSVAMYIVYVQQDTDEFNCLVPFTPTSQDGEIKSNGVQRMVKCTLEGIPIRLICVQALVLINAVAIIYAAIEWFIEHDACAKAKHDFKDMCHLSLTLDALDDKTENAPWHSFKYTDLDLLMYMTVRNLERENSKLWETCRFALRSARASQYDKECAGEEAKPLRSAGESYYDHLYGIVARGLDDDKEAETIAIQALAD